MRTSPLLAAGVLALGLTTTAAPGSPALGSPAHADRSRPTCEGRVATIVGTRGDDRLRGTGGDDVIVGLAGADVIDGFGGDDVICGGAGGDVLRGGPGNDTVLGGANDGRPGRILVGDDIDGGPGSDRLDPGRDRRRVAGQGTGDVLRWSHDTTGIQADLSRRHGTVVTSSGTDTVRVREGVWVLGSQHDDTIIGTRFDDDLEGNRGADVLDGGLGDDGVDEYAGLLSRADHDADTVTGGPGEDSLQANGGADVLSGDDGADFLYEQSYGPGAAMSGGTGDDDLLAWYDGTPGRTLDGGEGDDLLELDGADSSDLQDEQLVVDAGAGDVHSSDPAQAVQSMVGLERFTVTAEQPVAFLGTAAADVLDARFAERLTAQTFGGDDTVRGSSGNDTIDAGDGNDTVDGDGGKSDTCLDAEATVRCELP